MAVVLDLAVYRTNSRWIYSGLPQTYVFGHTYHSIRLL